MPDTLSENAIQTPSLIVSSTTARLPGSGTVISTMNWQLMPLGRPGGVIIFRPPILTPPIISTPPSSGVPRGQLQVPVCPAPAITDTVLLEDHADPSKKFFIPRYRIRVSNSQYGMSLEQTGPTWTLYMHLEMFAAPEIGPAAGSAQALPVTPVSVLQFTIPNTPMRKSLAFQTVAAEGDGWRAELNVASLAERDQLYFALTDPSAAAQLFLGREVTAATPMAATSGSGSSGSGTLRGTWMFDFDKGAEAGRGQPADVWWDQKTMTQRSLVPQGNALLANLGRVNFDSLSVDQLKNAGFSATPIVGDEGPGNQLTNGDVFAVLTKNGNYCKAQVLSYGYNLGLKWQTYSAGSGEPLYVVQSVSLTQIGDPNPFYFPPTVDGYIFKGITGGTGGNLGLQRVILQYNGQSYAYYQDLASPAKFYYLPDSFKIERKSGLLRSPDIAVRFTSSDGSLENMQAQLDYVAVPWMDADRLAAAATGLQGNAPHNSQMQLAPLQVDPQKLKLSIQLPRPDGSIGLQEQTGIQADLVYGISGSLPAMSIATFRTIYDAFFGGSDVLLSGRVEVAMATDGSDTQVVPFLVRIGDLVGDLLDETMTAEIVDLHVTLRNAIETAAKINRIDATIHTNAGTTVPGFVLGATLPAQLAPNQTLDFRVAGPALVPKPSDVSLKFGGLVAVPDPQATWSVIVDAKQPSEYQKKIHVQAFKPTFDPPANDPNKQIVAITVDFERADSVELVPGNADPQTGIIQSDVEVRMPIGSYVLNLPDQGQYRFKVTVVRKDGSHTTDTDWQSGSRTFLILTVPNS